MANMTSAVCHRRYVPGVELRLLTGPLKKQKFAGGLLPVLVQASGELIEYVRFYRCFFKDEELERGLEGLPLEGYQLLMY